MTVCQPEIWFILCQISEVNNLYHSRLAGYFTKKARIKSAPSVIFEIQQTRHLEESNIFIPRGVICLAFYWLACCFASFFI